ncbi:MAG: enoyl-CoA hydratase, partial [Gammaproteobacteria bacterium]|nr:enoyl-CoA hydratase [Gammaproteobacteria bacterium]
MLELQQLTSDLSNNVLTLTLNQPQRRNVLSELMLAEL